MRTAWLRWRELTIGERFALLQALFLLPLTGFLLRFFRYQSVFSTLQRVTPLKFRRSHVGMLREAQRTAELVNIAVGRGLYDATCLRRSLVLWWLLRRRGIESDLRIGARMDDGNISSHAWVEWRDTVLNDAADVRERYVVFF